ncbi:MAG: type IV pilin protein [Gammaproteobacteria bacterium]|nr:type IV pilin protein [Gammaproteobacteria bacterium]MDP6616016.1 type IV pilin protein [Gammaproteobacteria bacterium]
MVASDHAGFSLVELLIVISIVAIVTGIALPSWRDYIRAARRIDAMGTLLHVAARQEQFRLQNQHYADVHALSIAETTPGSDYRIHIVVTAAGFEAIATAAPDGKQYDDSKCWSFGIDETGRRWSRSASGIDTTRQCWKT